MTETISIDLTDEIIKQAWSAVFANDGHGFAYWCDGIESEDGQDFDWYADRSINVMEWEYNIAPCVVVFGEEEGEVERKRVTPEDIARAYVSLTLSGATHCNGCSIITDPDDCSQDMIMQTALFGKLVYG
jgi:hypothetical protein